MNSLASRPGPAPKSLSWRTARADQIAAVRARLLPARLIEDTRAEAAGLHGRIQSMLATPDTPPADLVAMVRAAVSVRSQLADLLGLATRPRGGDRRRPIDVPGIPTAALEITAGAPPEPPAPDDDAITR